MTKIELIRALTENKELFPSQAVAAESVNAILGAVTEGLKKDGEVSFIGFGSFLVIDKPARKGVNPQTGEPMDIAAHKTVRFHAGKPLRALLNGK